METYLVHHGIKGQKWGIRRYQNEDGTLTEAGKKRRFKKESRWSRGRRLNKEREKIYEKNLSEIRNKSKKYKDINKEIESLDREIQDLQWRRRTTDDFGRALMEGKNRLLNDRRWNKDRDRQALDSEFRAKAGDKATKYMLEKYGEESLSDIDHYQNINGGIAVAASILGAVGMYVIGNKILKGK